LQVRSLLPAPVGWQAAFRVSPAGQAVEQGVHDSAPLVPSLKVPGPQGVHTAIEVAPVPHGFARYRPGPHVVGHEEQGTRVLADLYLPDRKSVV
jgi:hypothetical protein